MASTGDDTANPAELTFDQLLDEASVGGDTDPALDDVCTDEEAVAAAARLGKAR